MGSSKKHKDKDRDHKKKKKKRSRSRSRSRERRRERRDRDQRDETRKRKHDYEDGELDEERAPPPVKKETDKFINTADPDISAPAGSGSGGDISLSIEETNKIRAKLGLKPLELNTDKEDDKTTKASDVHVPAVNLAEVKKTEALREKMAAIKEKRKINQKLGKTKTLADSDDEDLSASAWITKSRKIEKEKEMAQKRAQMLAEMDEEFGIGNLVEEEFGSKKENYTAKHLKGLKVQHDQSSFKEGQTVILTLQDKGILEENADDTLINVNMIDNEKANQNVENKKKKPDYKPWDEEEHDEYGMLKPKEILDKYDEEIYGKKQEYFTLDSKGKYDTSQERRMDEIKQSIQKQGQTLKLEPPKQATEYYTQDEMAKFNKVKKKVRKIRKKPKVTADELIPIVNVSHSSVRDHGRRRRQNDEYDPVLPIKEEPVESMDVDNQSEIPGLDFVKEEPAHGIPGLDFVKREIDDLSDVDDTVAPEEDLTNIVLEPDEAGLALESALHKARKAKQVSDLSAEDKVIQRVGTGKKTEEQNMDDSPPHRSLEDLPVVENKDSGGVNIVLNSTSEFCRTLGDIPTYGMSGNRIEDQDELMDFEKELIEERKKQQDDDENRAGWTQVEIDTEPVDIKEEDVNALDDEPVINEGLGSTLMLAQKKGYIDNEEKKQTRLSSRGADLQAKSYTIEDKRYDDLDEKYSRKRDRFQSGITMDFKELDNYKPDVKLEYIDDSGRSLNEKEAFRQLSHRFHGKGSGKRKTEKRMKKLEEENLMKQMSSTDTPLGTVNMLQQKQKAEKSPYIVLSGSKSLTANSVAKH